MVLRMVSCFLVRATVRESVLSLHHHSVPGQAGPTAADKGVSYRRLVYTGGHDSEEDLLRFWPCFRAANDRVQGMRMEVRSGWMELTTDDLAPPFFTSPVRSSASDLPGRLRRPGPPDRPGLRRRPPDRPGPALTQRPLVHPPHHGPSRGPPSRRPGRVPRPGCGTSALGRPALSHPAIAPARLIG